MIRKFFIQNRSATLDDGIAKFITEKSILLEIALCKCKEFSQCSCPWEKMIPENEQCLITDQRGPLEMFIGGLDHVTKKCD